MLQVGCEEVFVCRILWLHEPKYAKLRCKIFDYFGTHSNLYRLDSRKEQCFQFFVKVVTINNILKMTPLLELVCQTVRLHKSPIVSQTKITDDVQYLPCLNLIINYQPSTFQHINLL